MKKKNPVKHMSSSFHSLNLFPSLFVILIVLLFSFKAKADITTYSWPRELQGFSIEEIPGTSPKEYVAVGIIRYGTTIGGKFVREGVHFMHLDYNGYIICDRTFYMPENADEYLTFQPVDIAVENNNSFWVTVLFRTGGGFAPFDRDMIMIANYDANCNYIMHQSHPLNGLLPDHTVDQPYVNAYPMHTVFHAGHLYVCGYVTDYWQSGGGIAGQPMMTDWVNKNGMVLKLDVNSAMFTILSAAYTWNTPNTSGITYDYDMAIKMKVTGHNTIVVTGATNSTNNNYESSILAMELDANLNVINQNGLRPSTNLVHLGWGHGPSGVDIIEDHGPTGGYYILVNYQTGGSIFKWSVLHVDNNMQSITGVNSMISLNRSFQSGHNFVWGLTLFDDHTIYGQQMDLLCSGTVPSPHMNPSGTNIDPFLHFSTYTFSNSTGISKSTPIHKMQMSINGTTGGYMGFGWYYDIGRMFTPALQDNTAGSSAFKILAPVKDGGSGLLNAKFISTDAAGDETQCNTTYTDCESEFLSEVVYNEQNITATQVVWASYVWADPTDDNLQVVETDCSTGNYKRAPKEKNENKLQNTMSLGMGLYAGNNKKDLIIYPNPASDRVNISFSLDKTTEGTLEVVDVLGRKVSSVGKYKCNVGENVIAINTAELSTGIYIVKLKVDNQLLTKQLVIAK